MSYFKTLLIILGLFFAPILSNKCPKIRLIQPLDESTGFEYIIGTETKIYMISKENLVQTDSYLEHKEFPPGSIEPYGLVVYYNMNCSPPVNYLLYYQYSLDSQSNLYDWSTTLDLFKWTIETNWTEPIFTLPYFLNHNPYMNGYKFSFSMLWHKRATLYRIQISAPGQPQFNWDYQGIKIGTGPPDPCHGHLYFVDQSMKIEDILQPYDNFESCFIHNDKQIICFGQNGFTSYDIDLNNTYDGIIRVTNVKNSKTVQRIAIMKIIEDIRENCHNLSTKPIPTIPSTLPIDNFSEETDVKETTTERLDESKDDKPSLLWLFLLLILCVIIIAFICLLYCIRRKDKPNDDLIDPAEGPPIGDQQPNLDQMSNMSTRSQFGDKNKSNKSTVGFQPSIRSQMNNKTKGNKDMSNASTIDGQPSMRSQVQPDTKNLKMTGQSAIDSQTSMRSQINSKDKRNATQEVSNASTIGDQASVRSQNVDSLKIKSPNSSNAPSVSDSSTSMGE